MREEEERVERGLGVEEELNLRKGDRKEGEVLGEARVWENVGFRDCREEAAMVWCGGKTRRDETRDQTTTSGGVLFIY